jgi:hypothetical protein
MALCWPFFVCILNITIEKLIFLPLHPPDSNPPPTGQTWLHCN